MIKTDGQVYVLLMVTVAAPAVDAASQHEAQRCPPAASYASPEHGLPARLATNAVVVQHALNSTPAK